MPKFSKVFIYSLVAVVILCSGLRECMGSDFSDTASKGLAAYGQYKYDLAIKYFSQAMEENTNSAVTYALYALRSSAYEYSGKYKEALADINYAIRLDSNSTNLFLLNANSRNYSIRGAIYEDTSNYDAALKDFNTAVQIDPSFVHGYIEKAEVHHKKNNFYAMVADCDQAILLNSNLSQAYQMRADAYRGLGNFDRSLADYNKSIGLDSANSSTYFWKAILLAENDEYFDAITNLTEVIKLDPQNAWAYADRGFCYNEVGNYARGIGDCQKAIAIDPTSTVGYNNLAWLLATVPDSKLRNGQKALEYAKKACELTNWKDPQCLATFAAANAETGDFRDAVKWQKQAILGLSGKDLVEAQRLLTLYQQGKPYQIDPNHPTPR